MTDVGNGWLCGG